MVVSNYKANELAREAVLLHDHVGCFDAWVTQRLELGTKIGLLSFNSHHHACKVLELSLSKYTDWFVNQFSAESLASNVEY